MLEERPCLVSRTLRSSCGQDTKWVYMTYHLMEVSHGKRRFDDEGEEELFGKRKVSKRLGVFEEDGITPTLHNLFPSSAEQSDQQGQDWDQADTNIIPHLQVEEKGAPGMDEIEILTPKFHDLNLSLSNLSDFQCFKNEKLSLEDDKEEELSGRGKSSKLFNMNEKDELTLTMYDLQLSPTDQFHFPVQYQDDVNGKRPMKDESEKSILRKRKSSTRLDFDGKEEMTLSLHDLRLSSADQSDQPCHYIVQVESKVNCPLGEEGKDPLFEQGQAYKLLDMHVRDEMTHSVFHLSLSPADQSSHQGNDGDQSDTSSLIQSLGRDISINCLLRCSRSDYNSIASLNQSFRNLVRNGELYRLRRQMGVIEHWVYFSCDVTEWEAFDPIRRRWMHLPRMPSNECFRCSDKESVAVGTELLVFGKEIISHVIWKYSILTNSWSSGMEMNAPRCLFGSASLGEIAILAGGCDCHGRVMSSAELYNSETGTWETLPSMRKPRKMCSGVFMDGKFYVIGGSNTELLTCGEEYNLETRTWREIPNMCPRRTGPTEAPPLVAVVNNELYAADYAERELMKYNKERVSWDTVGRLPERAFSMNGWGLAFRACGEQLIVIGGPRALGEGMIELNSWVPREGQPQWNLLARKHSGSFVYNCAVMGC
ncbi:hypothetical protein AQUCO_07400017v1 [Aquilegia coerulea]|uniref:F-box domain-containing protein n=1 Tax=Aquilegia coerulea TaxID=218851 RepID=A0A2G5C9C4_AQUCA|nr:hypothetical protein AQUCO_07400017v1 [Aquilegia coerulea]PIA27891.1 hypothetical protein AQUCO_07400017v1 [Aquilegia coerulea]PIA27892.1 hypothetical protein AQUCO_07400017v1 [Aquilegia coerulea]